MNVILTNLDKPLVIESINRGHIVVDDLKVCPGWKEHSGVVATYQWKSQPNVVRKIKIGNDKVTTFQDISEAFNTELNKSSAGLTIASLNYKDGRVSLSLKPDTHQCQNSRRYREGIKDQTRQTKHRRTHRDR